VTADGRLRAGPLDWTGTVTASDSRTVAVAGVNVEPTPGAVVLYTPAWGAPVPDGFDTELILRAGGPVGVIGASTNLDIAGLQSDPVPVPADGAVLAASGSASTRLHELFDLADAGRISRTLQLRIGTAVPSVTDSVGGGPAVLAGGQPAFPATGDSFTADRHPRSLVGWNGAGEVVLVTVDANRPDASGMTMAEAADLLTGLGATDGFGFDNSAATFVAGGDVQNLPTDDVAPGAPAPADGREVAPGHTERPAVNALMVLPKAAGPSGGSGGSGGGSGAGSGGGSGSGSGSKPGGATTATTAPAKLTTAGDGSAPKAVGGLVTPTTGSAGSGLPSVDEILRNTTTKRPRRLNKGGEGKAKKSKDGQSEAGADPSIPDWNDINGAFTPESLAASGDQPAELSLGAAPAHHGPRHDPVRLLLDAAAAGMIVVVLSGLRRARLESRPRPALWL
ncbi:MAG TPA: phosphodiester glycosidase family protein, partial [Acidimicrobiia bacterium]|nr:phosphodiester glycosidase family protein [Acidimicrobiia bacterium]